MHGKCSLERCRSHVKMGQEDPPYTQGNGINTNSLTTVQSEHSSA
jgi:hypothetical protein